MNPFHALLGAYLTWGLGPLYWKSVGHLPTDYVLTNRVIWSFFLLLFILAGAKRLEELKALLSKPKNLLQALLTASLIGANWLIYIYAIQVGKTWEASLGYFLLPLLSVSIGALFFKEPLNRIQWLSVGLAAFAVAFLTAQHGKLPWITLALAMSFLSYSLFHKKSKRPAELTLLSETSLLFPLAAIYLGTSPTLQTTVLTTSDMLLLVAAGPVTVLPLFLFAYAIKRVPLTLVGITQYTVPTLTFLVAYFVFGENVDNVALISFGLIWCAIILFFVGKYWPLIHSTEEKLTGSLLKEISSNCST